MAQFTLNWINTAVLASANATGQRASYRKKSVGDPWITAGFSPANDLTTADVTADSPNSLDENCVYEFKVECLCEEGGPTINDNGIEEGIVFECLVPNTSQSETGASISLDVTGLDITKGRFTLRLAADNSIVSAATIVNRIGDTITRTVTGLTSGTNYYWQFELYATVNALEVISSSPSYLGSVCSPYPFNTEESEVCDAVESLDVSSVEIP